MSGGKPGPHKIQGIGAGFVPDILNTGIYDGVIPVENDDAFETSRRVAREEGILGRISSGLCYLRGLEGSERAWSRQAGRSDHPKQRGALPFHTIVSIRRAIIEKPIQTSPSGTVEGKSFFKYTYPNIASKGERWARSMILTTYEDWLRWSRTYSVLPLVIKHSLPQDRLISWRWAWEEASTESFVLESGKGGRYTFLGLKASSVIRGTDRRAAISDSDGTLSMADGKPLDLVKEWMAPYRSPGWKAPPSG